ncbi:MAG: hypothetical protein L3J67_02245 [Hyphomicrobiaceae bacterium]|nr:hypothetical protein [Hyphomicrobiaceae bacterium]
MQLVLGQVPAARKAAVQSVAFAERQEDSATKWQKQMMTLGTHAEALHQAGRLQEAEALFAKAEKIQAENQPSMPKLSSAQGAHYCHLLLTLDRPRRLLALAGLHRRAGEYALAVPLLNELFSIVTRAGLKLFLTDAWLESARLALAIGGPQ